MKKFNYKSRNGFTLIELLVVIGILAVLAAIAIPSVAGLIDRANVSADKTNSNEMTNAMERFASEYELFCQDIASGTFDKNNMDSAQGRVYNVLGIEDRAGIELVEIDADEPVDDYAIAIYRDTKYPANAYTAQLIVQNYTKTSSSTFEPKQSDMHYWYSPDCGAIVYAEPDAGLTPENIESKLNAQVISGMDAKGNPLDENTEWIDLTVNSKRNFSLNLFGKIPEGGTYYVGGGASTVGEFSGATEIFRTGENFPEPQSGDVFVFEDYEYRYNCATSRLPHRYYIVTDKPSNTWTVVVRDKTKTHYGSILNSICGKEITSLYGTFRGCSKMVNDGVPCIPTSVTDLSHTFASCTSVTNFSSLIIPSGVKSLFYTFENCRNLTELPNIPNTVTGLMCTFQDCRALTNLEHYVIPNSVTSMRYTFDGCKNLIKAPQLPNNVEDIEYAFDGCEVLMEIPTIPNSVKRMYSAFANCKSLTDVNITIPSNVRTLGRVFYNCTSLSGTITINTKTIKSNTSNSSGAYDDANKCFYGVDMRNITLIGDTTNEVLNIVGSTGNNWTTIE